MNRVTICMAMALLYFLMGAPAASMAQSVPEMPCQLLGSRDGQTITLHGQVGSDSHNMIFTVIGCHDAVVLVYDAQESGALSGGEPHGDKNLEAFRRYTSAVYRRNGKHRCVDCPKYEVHATLVGELRVAPDTVPEGQWKDKLGLLHDKTGKVVGKAGFGHPSPIYRYCLVITSVLDLKARKLPK